jgi:hypothetical protein
MEIIIRDNKKRAHMLIDFAILVNRNVIQKEAEDILKYKSLTIGLQGMWKIKTNLVPVILGTTVTI